MPRYIINANKQDSESGLNHEVHNLSTCVRLPLLKNRIDLGYFQDCDGAMRAAKARWPNRKHEIDGCYYCCPQCHEE